MHRLIVIFSLTAWLAAARQAPAEIPPQSQDVTLEAMPLLVARQSLLLAQSRILEANSVAAVEPLSTAARALAAFETQEPGPNGQTAEYMRQQIDDYSHVVAGDHSDALSRIDDWLKRIPNLCGGCVGPPTN
jgi:hypothetical protein